MGGSGEDLRNLVPIYRNVNLSTMKRYESGVKAAVDSGESVYYTVRPVYDGDRPILKSIVMIAWGD
ncbi:hypothetical protein GCM10018790_70200 [Kitasatospora xanthocidica]|nr:hypothetical protein GCM10018790_70200 [Kitasatospora xanthocidica]